jgi:hypothetical protein
MRPEGSIGPKSLFQSLCVLCTFARTSHPKGGLSRLSELSRVSRLPCNGGGNPMRHYSTNQISKIYR